MDCSGKPKRVSELLGVINEEELAIKRTCVVSVELFRKGREQLLHNHKDVTAYGREEE